jgi:hypothetical protein
MTLALMIAAVAAVGTAQPARPAAAPAARAAADPAAVAAAGQLVAILGVKPQLQRQMADTVKQMRDGVVIRAMLAQQPGFIPAYQANQARFDPVLKKAGGIQADLAQGVINQNLDAVVRAAVQAYARQYTLAELNGLIAFYRSPAGQAMQRKQGAVGTEIGQATARLIGARIDAAMQANGARLRDALAPLNTQPSAPPAAK